MLDQSKNQLIVGNESLYRKIKDFFKGHFLFLGYLPCIRSSSSEKDIKGLKRREKFEAENF